MTRPATARAVTVARGQVRTEPIAGRGMEPVWTTVDSHDLVYVAATINGVTLGATVDLNPDPDAPYAQMRDLARLDLDDRRVVAAVLALYNWHTTHPRCPRCGTTSAIDATGRSRTCPDCGHTEYARTDPEVLVLPTYGDAALLVHAPHWPQRMYSAVSGYLDPGETADQAACRELAEETGLAARRLTYQFSEPWPYHTA